jgi:hypothetical protein
MFVEDAIGHSNTIEEHLVHFEEMLQRLFETGYKLNHPKCRFGHFELSFLGHIVSREGVKPDPRKMEKLRDYPQPMNVKEIRQFVGLESYYRKFINDFARHACPFTELTKPSVRFHWGPKQKVAFQFLCCALSTEPVVLSYPYFDREFRVQTDASDVTISAILSQNDNDDRDHPICCYSRQLTPVERKGDTREKEALAIVWRLEKLRPFLLSSHFLLETDQRNLRWMMKAQKPANLSRWALRLREFDFSIVHRSGKQNANVDTLSRVRVLGDECCGWLFLVLPLSLLSFSDHSQLQEDDSVN